VPRFCARCPPLEPADPDARKEGGAGLFDELPGACRVAIAVGKTNEGESLPANLHPELRQQRPFSRFQEVWEDRCVPHFCVSSAIVDDGCELA